MAPRLELNQVTLPTVNVPAAVEFYKRLGFLLIVQTPEYARFECTSGNPPATFSLQNVPPMPGDRAGVHVYFESESKEGLDETVRELQGLGFHFSSGPEDKRWLWREAHLHDLDNNLLIFYYAGENRRFPPWRLPPS